MIHRLTVQEICSSSYFFLGGCSLQIGDVRRAAVGGRGMVGEPGAKQSTL